MDLFISIFLFKTSFRFEVKRKKCNEFVERCVDSTSSLKKFGKYGE